MLRVADIEVRYDEIPALRGITFQVNEGEIVSVIGSNGAGKTTLVKAISGLQPPVSGTIKFLEEDITKLPAYDIVTRGMSHVPEGRLVFGKMNVLDNLLLGAYTRHQRGEIDAALDQVLTMFPRLQERRFQKSETLSGGEQQMLATARSLMFEAKLLAIDEPSLGLAPRIREELFAAIAQIHADGVPVLLVEQEVGQVFRMAARNYVLSQGRIVAAGSAERLMSDETLRAGYLGL